MQNCVTVNGRVYPLRDKGKSGKHVRLTIGRDPETGRQIQRDFTGRNAAEIQEKIRRAMALSNREMGQTEADVTLDGIWEVFISVLRLRKEPRSLRTDLENYRNCIQPRFGTRNVRSIRPEEISDWQLEMRAQGRRENYIYRAFSLLRWILEYGRNKGYLHSNPCLFAREAHAESTEQSTLNNEQIRKLIVEGKDHEMAGLYALTLLLGLRNAEVCALSWKQIDWEKGTVRVCQQSGRAKGIIPHTKTKKDRTVKMPKAAILYLREELRKQQLRQESDGKWRNPEGLVFPNRRGGTIHTHRTNSEFTRIMVGVPGEWVTMHSLRRTTGSILAEQVSMHAAQYYLGHFSAATTLKYVYPQEKDVNHLIETMGGYFEQRLAEAGWPGFREERK